MQARMVLSLIVALIVVTSSGAAMAASRPVTSGTAELNRHVDDPISGEWEGLFEIGGGSATLVFKLKLDGENVTGTAVSAHTGPGTLSKGSWSDNKLTFTVDFAAHESVAVSGSLKDGQLGGEFRTEGMVGKWSAKKKAAAAANTGGNSAGAGNAGSTTVTPELIAGEWDATFEAQGTAVPVTFKLKVEGNQITGTSESAHLGSGNISKGTWTDNKLSFTLDGKFGAIAISGVLQEGKLVGEFDAGQMHGKFAANKK